MNQERRIYVAGHRGMVGSAIVRQLERKSENIIITRTHNELDLTNQSMVAGFFKEERIDEVYLAAARVGGIYANNAYPADFIYQNLMIESNVIHQAWKYGAEKLLFLGSSCIYPVNSTQPIKEEYLLTGCLEATNEPYAVAKIAGIKLCESYNRQHGTDFRSIMPTNLYGPGDNYNLSESHVIPALLRKFHEATVASNREVTIWGSGKQRREFLYVDDMARASIEIMKLPKKIYHEQTDAMLSHVNVGFGEDVTIADLAHLVADVVGFRGDILFDATKPDGAKQKLVDSKKMQRFGFKATIALREGLELAYESFLADSSRR